MDILSRPFQVKQAVSFIISTFMVGGLKVYLEQEFLSSPGPTRFPTLIMISAMILIVGFFTYEIWAGRNWARIVFTILFLIGVYPAVKTIPTEAERSMLVAASSAWQVLGQLIAVVLIFLPKSNKWFREIKQTRNA